MKLYRLTGDQHFVLRRYHISKASLMRWNELYDSTKESLADKSHRLHRQHPNAHTEEELQLSPPQSQYTMIEEATQERFYNCLSFYSYEDLQIQMKRYLYFSNRILMSVPG